VDPARNLVYVRGQVPGPSGSFVYLKDAHRVPEQRGGLPFPTVLGAGAPREVAVAKSAADPYRAYVADIGYFEETWKGGD
jgi:large subunit ribosomal protein L3